MRNGAKNFIGRSWGKAKHALSTVKETIDIGQHVYQNLKPIINEGVEAFGNARVKEFNQKAKSVIERGIGRGIQLAKEMTSQVDKIDDLSSQAFTPVA